jgi:hypothetical protein
MYLLPYPYITLLTYVSTAHQSLKIPASLLFIAFRLHSKSWCLTMRSFFLEHAGEMCIFVLREEKGWSKYIRHLTLDQSEGRRVS